MKLAGRSGGATVSGLGMSRYYRKPGTRFREMDYCPGYAVRFTEPEPVLVSRDTRDTIDRDPRIRV